MAAWLGSSPSVKALFTVCVQRSSHWVWIYSMCFLFFIAYINSYIHQHYLSLSLGNQITKESHVAQGLLFFVNFGCVCM